MTATPSVVVAFVTSRHPGDLSLFSELEGKKGFAFGLLNPAIGSEVPVEQFYLDISQGARVSEVLYRPMPERAGLFRYDGGGLRAEQFRDLVSRAKSASDDLSPGLLTTILKPFGDAPTLVAATTNPSKRVPVGLAAVSRRGVVERVYGFSRLRRAVEDSRLTVAAVGRAGLASVFKAVDRRDLLLLIGVPSSDGFGRHQLPLAVRGLGVGTLTSVSTRTDGLVTSTDITATLIDHFNVQPPNAVQGRPIEVQSGRDTVALESFDDRLSEIGPRRLLVLVVVALSALLLTLLLAAVHGAAGLNIGIRVTALALFILPAVMLLSAALRPSAEAEYALVAATALVLAALAATILSPRLALVATVGVSVVATGVDLAFDSALTQLSLMGPNPAFGARFFGIGNELEAYLGISLLVAAGVASDLLWPRRRSLFIALVGVAAVVVFGWERLGADVGAVVVIGVGTAVAVIKARTASLTARGLWLAVSVPAAALAFVVLIDLASNGPTHLTNTLFEGSVSDTLSRRLTLAFESLARTDTVGFAAVAALLAALAIRFRTSILSRVEGVGTRAGLVGAFVATLCGAVANDSGPIVLIIGVVELAFATSYLVTGPGSPEVD